MGYNDNVLKFLVEFQDVKCDHLELETLDLFLERGLLQQIKSQLESFRRFLQIVVVDVIFIFCPVKYIIAK